MRLIAVHTGDIAASPFLYRDKRIYTKMKARLYKEGFTYRFVGSASDVNAIKSGRVLPESEIVQDEPRVVVTRGCCGCGRTPRWEGSADGSVSAADYLAKCVAEAFTGEDGEAKGSGTIGPEGLSPTPVV